MHPSSRHDHRDVTSLSLDGMWDFFPGDHTLAELDAVAAEAIRVPGLWEAQGHLDLDGVAWYRRRFSLEPGDGCWTLRFGAVMDFADVHVNGTHVGSHESPFTPFDLDVTDALQPGVNVLAVRVVDPPRDHPDHGRMPHGKQGWSNDAFPSRPSLYMTYGGIWQSVTLRRHGPVVAREIFVNGDPADLVVSLVARNVTRGPQRACVRVSTLGLEQTAEVSLAAGERQEVRFSFGAVGAPRWSPGDPVLHEAVVAVADDVEHVRYGLRTVRVEGGRILLNGEPYRMKSVLVQGFHAQSLYAEGDAAEMRAEVLAAREMGFNTLRLHIKAFHPGYLDICDELGMLLHCDIPVAEPVEYDQIAGSTLLARRCAVAAREQVVRDRNHPSIVLWSAMNEIAMDRRSVRLTDGYEEFVRGLAGAVEDADPTRPVIENDWVEFEPARVFVSPILTAHWYGRLHRDVLASFERRARQHRELERPQLVTEYGDWGLPEMPEHEEPPFWDAREVYASGLALTVWPHDVDRFVRETQRYQGLCDRMQTELFRRHDHLSGYCLTELTDVPHELNGLLDLHRRPKPAAVAEMTRANQVVLPMLDLRRFVVAAGEELRLPLHVANDGAALADVVVEVAGVAAWAGELAAHRAAALGDVVLRAPAAPGPFDVRLRLLSRGTVLAENRYPLRAVELRPLDRDVCLLGDEGDTADALAAVGARLASGGTAVVAQDALDEAVAAQVRDRVDAGETVLLLAQHWDAARWFPLSVAIRPVDTRWGGSIFCFTTEASRLAAFPVADVLVGEDATLHARDLVTGVAGGTFAEQTLVARFNPRGTTGTLIGSHPCGRGRLVFCQYRLARPAAAGDPAAQSLLADLVRLAQPQGFVGTLSQRAHHDRREGE
jgi:hypothetical protein